MHRAPGDAPEFAPPRGICPLTWDGIECETQQLPHSPLPEVYDPCPLTWDRLECEVQQVEQGAVELSRRLQLPLQPFHQLPVHVDARGAALQRFLHEGEELRVGAWSSLAEGGGRG